MDFSKIHDNFASIFENRLLDYKNARQNNKITRVEYLVLFVHLVVGTEIITSEKKLEKNKYFTIVPASEWSDKYICNYLQESVKKLVYVVRNIPF